MKIDLNKLEQLQREDQQFKRAIASMLIVGIAVSGLLLIYGFATGKL